MNDQKRGWGVGGGLHWDAEPAAETVPGGAGPGCCKVRVVGSDLPKPGPGGTIEPVGTGRQHTRQVRQGQIEEKAGARTESRQESDEIGPAAGGHIGLAHDNVGGRGPGDGRRRKHVPVLETQRSPRLVRPIALILLSFI